MDRPAPEALVQFKWHRAVLCYLHSFMRTGEGFFKPIQDRVIAIGKVTEFNAFLALLRVGYKIYKPKEAKVYNSPSFRLTSSSCSTCTHAC